MNKTLAALLFTLTLALPLQATSPATAPGQKLLAPTDVHLVRYAYAVEWSGAGGVIPQGQAGVAVLVDLKNDQHQLQLVRSDGVLVGRMVQQGVYAFFGATGEHMEPSYDLLVGMGILGVPVGLSTLADWAQGKDGRGPAAKARIQHNEDGTPKALREEGWTVRYEGWTNAKGDAFPVPTAWELTHEYGLQLRLELVEAEGYSGLRIPDDYNPISIR